MKWGSARRRLKQSFERQGITRCERCGGTFGLGFAHRYKRRKITTDEELMTAALLCQLCHHFIEYGTRDEAGTHERMYELVTQIIEARNGNHIIGQSS